MISPIGSGFAQPQPSFADKSTIVRPVFGHQPTEQRDPTAPLGLGLAAAVTLFAIVGLATGLIPTKTRAYLDRVCSLAFEEAGMKDTERLAWPNGVPADLLDRCRKLPK